MLGKFNKRHIAVSVFQYHPRYKKYAVLFDLPDFTPLLVSGSTLPAQLSLTDIRTQLL